MTLWRRLAAFFVVVGILSPPRVSAATIHVLGSSVTAVGSTATMHAGRLDAVRRKYEEARSNAYESVCVRYDDLSNLRLTGAEPAAVRQVPDYDRGLEHAYWRTLRAEGVIDDLAATGIAAEGGGGLLAASELAGGHAFALHAGLDAAALDARLAAEASLKLASSFAPQAEAEAAAAGVLGQNVTAIQAWTQAGAVGRLPVSGPFSGGLIRALGGYSAEATGARFVLQGNGTGSYFILTGFPIP